MKNNIGLGMGMSICKQLVNLMGGRIWLHWAQHRHACLRAPLPPSRGRRTSPKATSSSACTGRPPAAAAASATCLRRRPRAARRAAAPRPTPPRRAYSRPQAPPLRGARGGGQRLQRRRGQADAGTPALEAVAADGCRRPLVTTSDLTSSWTERGPFDLVLMDCDMPIMNGFDATRAIRGWERTTGAASAQRRIPVSYATDVATVFRCS